MKPVTAACAALALLAVLATTRGASRTDASFVPRIPRTWDSAALADFTLPPPDPSVEVRLMPEEHYYSLRPRVIYESFPVYHPDHEPGGYIESLRRREPVVAFDPTRLVSEEDWIRAGETVFDAPHLLFPIEHPFGARAMAAIGVKTTKDAIFPFARYVVTPEGLRIGFAACGNCHTRVMDDGTVVKGAPGNFDLERLRVHVLVRVLGNTAAQLRATQRELYRAPWIDHPSQTRLDSLTVEQYVAAHHAVPVGVLLRQGTSLDYPARVPDLRGIRDIRYLDATGHMQHRGPGDLMRYATFNESVDMLTRYDDWIPEYGRVVGPWPPPDSFIRRYRPKATRAGPRSSSTRSRSSSTRSSRCPARTRPTPRG